MTYNQILVDGPHHPSFIERVWWPLVLAMVVCSVIGFATPSMDSEQREAYLGQAETKISRLMDTHHALSEDSAWDNVKNENAYFHWLEALDREVEALGDAFYLAENTSHQSWPTQKNRLDQSIQRVEILIDRVKAQMFRAVP